MKFSASSLTAVLLFASQALGAAMSNVEARDPTGMANTLAARGVNDAQCKSTGSVNFYRAYSSGGKDHFYTTNLNEYNNAVHNLGYSAEGVAAHIFTGAHYGAVPLYRAYSPKQVDHFYTIDLNEKNNAVHNLEYNDEGIAGYVFPCQLVGSVPLYRTYSGGAGDHFYTTSFNEKQNAVQHLGYTDEGIAAYVWS